MQDGKPRKGYRYIQTPHGSLVAAYEYVDHVVGVHREVESRSFRVGLAYCSRRDRFTRERGRMIADGRLDKKRSYGYLEFVSLPDQDGSLPFPNFEVESILSEIRVNTGRMDIGPCWLPRALAHFYTRREKEAA